MKRLLATAISLYFLIATLPPAGGQTPPAFGGNYTPYTNAVAALGITTNNAAKRPIDVPASSIAVFGVTLGGANIGTSNVVFSFNGSLNGSSWTKTFPLSMTGASTGSNASHNVLILGTNLTYRFISLDKVETTSTNIISISNVVYTFFPFNP